MKGKTLAVTAVAVAVVLGATTLVAKHVSAHGQRGHWNAATAAYKGGHGMMGHGYGHGAGYGGPCRQELAALDKELTTADVTKLVERHLALHGNDRLKVGPVTEKDANTIVADIVTVDESLVWRFEFDRATGRMDRVD